MTIKTLFNSPPKQDGYDFRTEKQSLSRAFLPASWKQLHYLYLGDFATKWEPHSRSA